jgi:hypothetical protein
MQRLNRLFYQGSFKSRFIGQKQQTWLTNPHLGGLGDLAAKKCEAPGIKDFLCTYAKSKDQWRRRVDLFVPCDFWKSNTLHF